jgi:hypothetical protein
MSNPWLEHLKKFHEKHPENSYKENMKLAKPSYTPVKKQTGKGLMPSDTAITAVASVANKGLDLGSEGLKASQTNKLYNGSYDAKIVKRKANLFKKYKTRMEKGKFPKMSDSQLWTYVNREINSEM